MSLLNIFKQSKKIEVKVDKNHISAIGQRMYVESIELLRELINNAYDADAENVRVLIKGDQLIVEDDGSGMDAEGLAEYFNIGSSNKKSNPISPKHRRLRIGEFGIGKFSTLTACDRFEVYTQKNKFAAKVSFNYQEWKEQSDWSLPVEIVEASTASNGTTVTLYNIKKQFELESVRKNIVKKIPIKARNFNVFINDEKLKITNIPGKKYKIKEKSPWGQITGEIILLPAPTKQFQTGIDCFVKNIFIKNDHFGYHHDRIMSRIVGEINADFLHVISSRSDFIQDSVEFKFFQATIKQKLKEILSDIEKNEKKKEKLKVTETIKEIAQIMRKLVKNNPDLFTGSGNIDQHKMDQDSLKEEGLFAYASAMNSDNETDDKERHQKKVADTVKKKRAYNMRQIDIGGMGVTFLTDHYGEDSPPSFTEYNIICINMDDKFYRRQEKNSDALMIYIIDLLIQEVIKLKKDMLSPENAFDLHNKLLREAFC